MERKLNLWVCVTKMISALALQTPDMCLINLGVSCRWKWTTFGGIKKPKWLFLWHSCCLLSAKEWHLETGQSWREVCAFPGFAPCFWRVLSNLCSSCHLPGSILIIYGCFFSFSSSRMTFGMPNMLHAGLHLPAEVFKGNIWIYLAPGTYTAVIALI